MQMSSVYFSQLPLSPSLTPVTAVEYSDSAAMECGFEGGRRFLNKTNFRLQILKSDQAIWRKNSLLTHLIPFFLPLYFLLGRGAVPIWRS